MKLSGKIALVTGGAKGIGAAISKRLAADGATVIVNFARSEEAAHKVVSDIEAKGGKAFALQADISSDANVKELFKKIDKIGNGTLDILVNNAGVYLTALLGEYSSEDYRNSFKTNVDGVFIVTKEAAPRLRDNGRIITIGSVLGERALGAGLSVYSASKFAVAGLTRGFAHEFADRGITSNVVQPGPINTDMNPSDEQINPSAAAMKLAIPLKRYGRPEEVAAVVSFLASEEASYVNGSTINVDGGMNA